MKTRRYFLRKFVVLTILLVSFQGCDERSPAENQSVDSFIPSDSVTVIYVHQKKGCITCRAISKAMERVEERFGTSPVAFRDWLISEGDGETVAAVCDLSYAGVVVCRKDSNRLLFSNLTADAFLLATVRPDSLDRLMDATIRQHLSALQTKND
ncbi:MAG: hypothetical protein PHQ65_13080 [Bacteroidales bacterium]|nr:hypothetical protein [Bacteroidales bacterium]MDD3666192.1 hypothetical protein [Bacteroidales bacterium]